MGTTLRDLAGNPLYLTLMALLIEKDKPPARQRTGLYDQVFQLLLDGGHRPAGEPIEAQVAVRGVLRHLAHARQIAVDDLSRWAEPYALLTGRVENPDRTIKSGQREIGIKSSLQVLLRIQDPYL